MIGERATDRLVFEISGTDRVKFLQGLVTNDVDKIDAALLYAALLTPQGKYLCDFFLFQRENSIFLDVDKTFAPGLIQRLNMYKLRADVLIEPTQLYVQRGTGTAPAATFADPRHPALGWRKYDLSPGQDPRIDWDAIRVAHSIPQTGVELLANESFILEAGFEALSGVDFKKGCYVGQEITARMKHKTELRKGLVQITIDGSAEIGAEITKDGKIAGRIFTQSAGKGIAYLRFDRAEGEMSADGAIVRYK